MIQLKLIYTALLMLFVQKVQCLDRYTPDWNSLDKRPLPQWYDDAKVGIFIHWGVFSVPSYSGAWFWWDWKGSKDADTVNFMNKNYPSDWTYPDFATEFRAEFFDPNQWADIFSASGAKYVVLTSKHHEGYCLWPSKNSFNWNSKDVGPNRDLVGDLANAIRLNTTLRFGLYHSLFEWFNPLYLSDKANDLKSQDFVKYKTLPELFDIVNTYKPDVIWSDGEWEAPDSYWNSKEFIAWLYNDSPVKETVVVNDRWGNNLDRYNPRVLIKHKWENCFTLDRDAWGSRRDMTLSDVLSIQELITTLAETVSCGGNVLINVGPTKEGTIPVVFEERLRQLGAWLGVNGEAIYETKPWKYQNDTTNSDVWYTSKGDAVYGIVTKYPKNGKVRITAPQAADSTEISLLGYSGKVQWVVLSDKSIVVYLSKSGMIPLNLNWGFVIKFKNII